MIQFNLMLNLDKKVSLRSVIVAAITAVFLMAAAYTLIIGYTVEIPAGGAGDGAGVSAEKKSTCVRYGSEDDIYSRGRVETEVFYPAGNFSVKHDECSSNKTQVLKGWCYEHPSGSGNYVDGRKVFDCEFGCEDGACRPRDVNVLSRAFDYPYPVSWAEEGARGAAWFFPMIPSPEKIKIEFSLEEVSLGTISAPAGLMKFGGAGSDYDPGEDINALTLKLRISNKSDATTCPELTIRRIINEVGDAMRPNTRQFEFPGGGGCQISPNSTYGGREVIFVVPEGEKQFMFTTGGTSNVFFSVTEKDGALEVQNISAQKEG